jgi:NADPH:quinone reductase-like Zn-dependent oxidoreductase
MSSGISCHQLGAVEDFDANDEADPAPPIRRPRTHATRRSRGARIEDLEELARAVADSKITLPIARTVPLTEAIDALTELEQRDTPEGGKLVISPR